MRSLVLMLAVVAPLAADESFAKVPYARAVDEIVFSGIKNGTIKPPYPDRVRVKGGKVEAAYGTPGSDKTEWKEIEDDGRYTVFAFMVFLDDAKYDSDGFYMLARPVYDQIKGKLIHRHKGRLESFLKKDAKEKPGELGSDDPKDWETFVWDADDKCWRWPQTLGRVKKDFKLTAGTKLYDHTPLATLKTGVIEDLLTRWRAKAAGKK